MARTAFTAPAHTVQQRSAPGNLNNAPDSAPSLVYGGQGLLDHRMPYNMFNGLGQGVGAALVGWTADGNGIITYDGTPPAAAATNLAALANVPAGLLLPLVTTSGAGIIVNATPFVSYPFMNTIPVGALAIQSIPVYLKNGIRDITAWYDPTTSLALAVSITGSSSSAGQNFTVRGYDYYGMPMSEVIAGPAGATTVNGKKAFKWVVSITGTTAEAQNYSAGTTLIAGFHLAIDTAPYAAVSANNASFTVPGTFVAALTSAAPSATNADVRGTGIVAANHTVMTATVSAARLTGTNSGSFTKAPTPLSVGLFGQTQFTN